MNIKQAAKKINRLSDIVFISIIMCNILENDSLSIVNIIYFIIQKLFLFK